MRAIPRKTDRLHHYLRAARFRVCGTPGGVCLPSLGSQACPRLAFFSWRMNAHTARAELRPMGLVWRAIELAAAPIDNR